MMGVFRVGGVEYGKADTFPALRIKNRTALNSPLNYICLTMKYITKLMPYILSLCTHFLSLYDKVFCIDLFSHVVHVRYSIIVTIIYILYILKKKT